MGCGGLRQSPPAGRRIAPPGHMPRISRGTKGDQVLHVLNRGNARATLFHEPADYAVFIELLNEARNRFDVRIYAFCVMPNHFHLVLHPRSARELSAMLQWWL